MLDAVLPYQPSDPRQVAAAAGAAQDAGMGRLWLTQSLGLDAQLLVAALAPRFPRLAFGTGVALMPLRHPVQAAIEARTLAVLTGGRFALGLGVSERAVVEEVLGLEWAPACATATEYVAAVRALASEGRAQVAGRHVRVSAELARLPAMATPAPVLLGALGAAMAGVAGRVADGCLTWLAPPAHLETTIVPAVRAGAEVAGRRTPDVIAMAPVALTDDARTATRVATHAFGAHLTRPHYRRILAAAGLTPPSPGSPMPDETRDALLAWGDAATVAARLRRYRDAGAARVAIAAYPLAGDPAAAYRDTWAACAEALDAFDEVPA